MTLMNTRSERLCVIAGPSMLVAWALGFALLARFVPPPSPELTASDVGALIRTHLTGIRLGLVVTCLASALNAPFVGEISVFMKRVEGNRSPLAYAQLALGACLVLEFLIPMMILEVATFRPERSDEMLQLVFDLGWVLFFGMVCTVALQAILFGLAVLVDDRKTPLLPRWSGYFSIWCGICFTPGGILVFFKNGPFAWNGLLTFWMAVVVFTAWVFIMSGLMYRSLREEQISGDSDVDDLVHPRLAGSS